MEKKSKVDHPEVIILSGHEQIEAEEYIEDIDHVYRKKEDVSGRFHSSSIFWSRLTSFLGLLAASGFLAFKVIKFFLYLIQALLHRFAEQSFNQELKKLAHECFVLSKVILGLSVSVINPRWGKRLLSLFFSIKNRSSFQFSTV